MADVYLDTNILADIFERRTKKFSDFIAHDLFISPLSVHILAYTYKYRMPSEDLISQVEQLNLVQLSTGITLLALAGPTEDLEDNIQLHSAAQSDCDYFVTSDQQLLAMKFFGKVKIVSAL